MKRDTLEARRTRLRAQLGKISDAIAKLEDRARVQRQVLFRTERALGLHVAFHDDDADRRFR